MVKTTTKLKGLKNGNMVYEARVSCSPAPRGYNAEDTDAWDAKYEIESFVPSYYDDARGIIQLRVGDEYMILSGHDITKNCPVYWLSILPDNGRGWVGNSSPLTYMYRGWRGTTNNWHAGGEGLRKVISINITGKRSKKLRIVFGPDASN